MKKNFLINFHFFFTDKGRTIIVRQINIVREIYRPPKRQDPKILPYIYLVCLKAKKIVCLGANISKRKKS